MQYWNEWLSIREETEKYFGIAIDFTEGSINQWLRYWQKAGGIRSHVLEEPCQRCEQMEDFKEIAACCSIPIATGERLYSRWDYKQLFQSGGISIIQPDLSHAGGLTEVRKIASMAEAYDDSVSPHCPLGPIALSACLQVDAVCYNAVIQEQSIGIHYNVGKKCSGLCTQSGRFHV